MRAVALTIAGSDPSGGAGAQADLKTFAALEVYGLSAITILTAQDSTQIYDWAPVAPAMVRAQIQAAVHQSRPGALKIGTVGSAPVAAAIADSLAQFGLGNVVIDPVMVSSSGTRLLNADAEAILRDRLLPAAIVVTPNLAEASVLSGLPVTDFTSRRQAARVIHKLGPSLVVIKGGHLSSDEPASDLAFDGTEFHELSAPRIPGPSPHGTGCAFSAAIAAWIARGQSSLEAVRKAKRFVTAAIAFSFTLDAARPLLDHATAGREQE